MPETNRTPVSVSPPSLHGGTHSTVTEYAVFFVLLRVFLTEGTHGFPLRDYATTIPTPVGLHSLTKCTYGALRAKRLITSGTAL